jgi:surfeit locus 1 family protein
MIIFKRRFKPTLRATVIALAGFVFFVSLGAWQLERADYKDAIEQKFESRLEAEYRQLDTRAALLDLEFRKLELLGEYDLSRTFLVDNQLHHGQAGYHVLSPFELAASNDFVLVNRGWVAVGKSRDLLPSIEPPVAAGVVRGIANIPGEDIYRMGQISLQENWPQVVPFIDLEAIRAQFKGQLLPFILWLGPEQPGHYKREWNPVWAKPEKSRAYAWQWFSFALISLILYLVLNLRNENEKQ